MEERKTFFGWLKCFLEESKLLKNQEKYFNGWKRKQVS